MTFAGNHTFSILKEKYFGDIRFWIILFFILRLYGITDPPLEIAHNWRQVTGNMVARNFYEMNNNILYPCVDMAGEKSGITGTEFPTLNYLTYLLSAVFGFHDWFGRLINLVISSFGILYFYKLVRLKFDEKLSFYASFLLLTSMWIMYSRKAMPDTFSTSLVIIGLYFAFSYFANYKRGALIAYFFFVTLGVLSKIPAAYLLIVLAFPLLNREIEFKHKVYICLFTLIMFIPVVWWYFYWVPYLVDQFGFWYYYMGTSFTNGFQEIISNVDQTLEKFYFGSLKYSGFIACVAGLFVAFIKKEKRLLFITLLCSFAFGVFMLKAGRNFFHHSYYVIPFVPIMCLLAAYAVIQVKKQWIQLLILLAITAESIGNQSNDFTLKASEKYKLSLEAIADKVSERDDLIAINGDFNPQQVYFLHRKGWTISSGEANDKTFMNDLARMGCKFLFVNKHLSEGIVPVHQQNIVYNDANFIVYLLTEK